MRRWLPWLGVAAAGLTLLLALALTFVAVSSQRTASGSLDSAQRLFDARKAVAQAQAQLGDTDLKEGIEAGREANAVALRVKGVTERIVRLLEPTEQATRATVASARRGVRGAVVARRETATAAEIIGAVDGYQRAATRYAAQTNRSLRRILRALRRTNAEFPPTPLLELP